MAAVPRWARTLGRYNTKHGGASPNPEPATKEEDVLRTLRDLYHTKDSATATGSGGSGGAAAIATASGDSKDEKHLPIPRFFFKVRTHDQNPHVLNVSVVPDTDLVWCVVWWWWWWWWWWYAEACSERITNARSKGSANAIFGTKSRGSLG